MVAFTILVSLAILIAVGANYYDRRHFRSQAAKALKEHNEMLERRRVYLRGYFKGLRAR